MSAVAGVVFVTAPGSAAHVAARLVAQPGLTLVGGDGDARLAAVWEASDGAAIEDLAERLMAEDAEILGVYPTFIAAPMGPQDEP